MTDDTIHLKDLCAEQKVPAREARARLRWAVKNPKDYPELSKAHKPREAWKWEKGSLACKEAAIAIGKAVPKN